jgi:hypothetical protein
MMLRISLLTALALVTGVSSYGQATYGKEISRLMQAKCQGCHRPGDIAPFPLMTYSDVAGRLGAIRSAVSQRKMPPWKPLSGGHKFAGDFGLTDEERKLLLDWVGQGAPEGNAADLPAALPLEGDWQLGQPDVIVPMAQPHRVEGNGDSYRCFSLPFEADGERWLRALQVLPGTRAVVHHALVFADPAGASLAREGKDGQPGYPCFGDAGEGVEILLGAWVPGARVTPLPDGIGIPLEGRGRIVLQVHYHRHLADAHSATAGVHLHHYAPVTDLTKVGLYFTKEPPARDMIYVGIGNEDFEIAPGAADHEVTASLVMPLDLDLVAAGPHMHLLGRKIRVEMTLPEEGAKAERLIAIDDWDFDYQGFYQYEKPVTIPFGATLNLSCRYDNTAANPKNPSEPPKMVRFGEGTEDEMCLAFLGVALPEGARLRDAAAPEGPNRVRAMWPKKLQ